MKRVKELVAQRSAICKRQDETALTKLEDEIFSICKEKDMHSIAVKCAVDSEHFGDLGTFYILCDDEVKTMLEGIENIYEMVSFVKENKELYVEVYGKPNVIDKKIDFSEEFLAIVNDDSIPFKDKLF